MKVRPSRSVAVSVAVAMAVCAIGCSVLDVPVKTWSLVTLAPPDSSCLLIVDCLVTYRGDSDRLDKLLLRSLDDALGGKPEAVPVAGVLVDSMGNKYRGMGMGPGECEGLILFTGLKAGTYRLWRIESSYYLSVEEKKETYGWNPDGPGEYPDELFFKHDLSPENSDSTTITIDAGEFLYYGTVILDEKHDAGFGDKKLRTSPPPHIEERRRWEVDRHTCSFGPGQWRLTWTPEHEMSALENLLRVYGPCPWSERWRQRLAELGE